MAGQKRDPFEPSNEFYDGRPSILDLLSLNIQILSPRTPQNGFRLRIRVSQKYLSDPSPVQWNY